MVAVTTELGDCLRSPFRILRDSPRRLVETGLAVQPVVSSLSMDIWVLELNHRELPLKYLSFNRLIRYKILSDSYRISKISSNKV